MNRKSTPSDPLTRHAVQTLSSTGGRMTTQRRLILAALAESPNHPTAEEIYHRVLPKNPALNLSTVYRTLRWLEQEGLINSRHFEGEPHQDRFDPIADERPDHHHFRCRVCNRIIEFDAPLLEQVKQIFVRQQGGQVESAALVLYGLCRECAVKKVNTDCPEI